MKYVHNKTTHKQDVESEPYHHDTHKDLLKMILSAAQDEYKIMALEWRNRQTLIIRTYLWISVVAIAAQISLFLPVWAENHKKMLPWELCPTVAFFIFVLLALLCSFYVFVLGVDTLRGRDGIRLPYEHTYSRMCDHSYKEATEVENSLSLYLLLIKNLETAINHQKEQNVIAGLKLRRMSCFLLIALFFTGCALLPQYIPS